MTNDHSNLETYLGEDAGYFPASATSEIPSATQVDGWYTGPIADVLSHYDFSSTLIEDMLAEDMLAVWKWRKRSKGAVSAAVDFVGIRPPEFPSYRTKKYINEVSGFVYSEG